MSGRHVCKWKHKQGPLIIWKATSDKHNFMECDDCRPWNLWIQQICPKLFALMKHLGTNPNNITFVCVLFVCNHGTLMDESCKYLIAWAILIMVFLIWIFLHAFVSFLAMQDISRRFELHFQGDNKT